MKSKILPFFLFLLGPLPLHITYSQNVVPDNSSDSTSSFSDTETVTTPDTGDNLIKEEYVDPEDNVVVETIDEPDDQSFNQDLDANQLNLPNPPSSDPADSLLDDDDTPDTDDMDDDDSTPDMDSPTLSPQDPILLNRFFNSIIDGSYKRTKELIEKNGMDVNAPVGLGSNPPLVLAIMSGHVNIVELLLEKGAKTDPYPLDSNGYSTSPQPLLIAVARIPINGEKFFKITQLLLKYKANPNDINLSINGFCPLMMAITYIQNKRILYAVVKLLLTHDANPNIVKNVNTAEGFPDQISALHIAVMRNQSSIIPLLLKYHANPNISANNGQTALELARQYERHSIVVMLENYTKNNPPVD